MSHTKPARRLMWAGICAVAWLALGACSARRLAPGTPAPEYEAPTPAPWLPESANPSASGAASSEAAPPTPANSSSGVALSPDAGVR